MARLTPTHWHILGAGSIGCLWAYYLAKAGHHITLICKNTEQANALRQATPLILKKNNHEYKAARIEINCIEHIPEDRIDNLLICLKAHQTENAILAIKPSVSRQATLVLMQNGMGNQQLLEAVFPDCAIYAALTTEAACKYDTLSVEHTGQGVTQIGTTGKQIDDNILQKLHCELPVEENQNIETTLWQKLVINCCINPLTVIYHCKNGELANNPEALETIKDIINECRAITCAIGNDSALQNIDIIVNDVINKTARNTSSMLQDVQQHRSTEINYINGFISQLGENLGIPTPVNDHLVATIKSGDRYV